VNQTYNYWYFKDIVPRRYCDYIIKYGLSQKEQVGLTHWDDIKLTEKIKNKDPEALKLQHKKRKSHVVWMSDPWIYNLIRPSLSAANINSGWNLTYDWIESCQFTIYRSSNYYDWHCDTEPVPKENRSRKLSASLFLSEREDYTGGDFEFKIQQKNNGDNLVTKVDHGLSKGSLLVFPSHYYHRVTPVLSGERYSLVAWTVGPQLT